MAAMVGDVTNAGTEASGSIEDDGFLDLDELVEIEASDRRSLAAKLVELNAMRTRAEITEAEFNRRKAELYGPT